MNSTRASGDASPCVGCLCSESREEEKNRTIPDRGVMTILLYAKAWTRQGNVNKYGEPGKWRNGGGGKAHEVGCGLAVWRRVVGTRGWREVLVRRGRSCDDRRPTVLCPCYLPCIWVSDKIGVPRQGQLVNRRLNCGTSKECLQSKCQ